MNVFLFRFGRDVLFVYTLQKAAGFPLAKLSETKYIILANCYSIEDDLGMDGLNTNTTRMKQG